MKKECLAFRSAPKGGTIKLPENKLELENFSIIKEPSIY